MSANWAPNPIALARTLLGGTSAGRGWPRSWDEAEALLGDAYGVDAQVVFRGTASTPAIIDLIRDIADDAASARALADVLAMPAVRAFSARVKQGDALARVLPYIVPVTGASFAAPGTGFALLADAPPIASYERIGALDVGGVSWRDPAQGNVADCYLIATMSAIAWARPATWVQRLSEATHGSKDADALSVSFHAEVDGLADPPAFDVPPRVPLDVGHNWIYAHSAQSEETWPALLERAYVMQACDATQREPTIDDYRSIGAQRHWPHAAGRALIGGTAKSRRAGDAATLFSDLVSRCDASLTRFPTMAWTKSTVSPGLVQDHAYSVLGTLSRDERQYVVLRNPYGVNARTASFAGGEWDEGAPRNGGQPVTLDANGVFALPESDFDASFDGLGWVEVPEDPPGA